VIDFGRPSPPLSSLPSDSSKSSFHIAGAPARTSASRLLIRELPPCDPFALYAALRAHARTCFLLESAPSPERLAEYTYIGFEPDRLFALRDRALSVNGRTVGPLSDPLEFLRETLAAHRPPVDVRLPKYLGGLVGYVGYDFARTLEPSLSIEGENRKTSPFSDFELGLYLDGVIYDHRARKAIYFSHGEDRSEFVSKHLAEAEHALDRPHDLAVEAFSSDVSQDKFEVNVRRALGLIRDGEVYQLVLSRQLRGRYQGDLFAFYRALRAINPSPYMYCLEFDRDAVDVRRMIVGSSPEMLVSVRERRVITYPIAGTRALGRHEAERARLAEELLADEKERAEHAMLVDLARNDVGRVSAFGTLHVPQYLGVERFSHVQHLVSRVEGHLKSDLDALDALAALFPAGTVTGAPKLRAMEWIRRLERSPRGPYAGVVGYLSLTGDLDTAIAIRTLFAHGGELYLQAGAGIVADSVPKREWAETEQKLGALVRALEEGSRCGCS
jgi:anthranilate synthase component 1